MASVAGETSSTPSFAASVTKFISHSVRYWYTVSWSTEIFPSLPDNWSKIAMITNIRISAIVVRSSITRVTYRSLIRFETSNRINHL